ncbi:hypothetical protein N7490_002590 [Penicillium lividum]|nr:hypothetical protein N7490_002590 [Penicillium lividum]
MTLCDSEGLENAWQKEGPTVVNQFSRKPPQGKHTIQVESPKKLWFTRSTGYSSTSEPPTVIYEGYKFFKADPIPGEEASWTKVERTKMLMTQSDFCRKVQKRANKISAAQQYQFLSEVRQAHINQLIAERRLLTPEVEWSCVYAKEREKPSKARNAHRDDYEIVSMQIILMQRPVKTKTHFRTPMGDLVDLGVHFGPRPDRARWSSDEETHGVRDTGLLPRNRDHFIPAFPRPRRSQTFSGNEAGQDRLEREPLPRPATATAIRRRPELNDQRWANVDDEEAAHSE